MVNLDEMYHQDKPGKAAPEEVICNNQQENLLNEERCERWKTVTGVR